MGAPANGVGQGSSATWQILRDPGFLRPLDEMRASDPWISRSSRFGDARWDLDVEPPCQVPTLGLSWKGIRGGLADELKLAVLRHGGAGPLGRAQSVLTMASAACGAIPLGRWMSSERLRSLSDLGEGGGDAFLNALAERIREVDALDEGDELSGWDPRMVPSRSNIGRSGRMTQGNARNVATFLLAARTDTASLRMLGVKPLLDPPFAPSLYPASTRTGSDRLGRRNLSLASDGVTAAAIADAFGDLKKRIRERLPDAVRDPMLTAFESLLGPPAEDFLRFMSRFAALVAEGRTEQEALSTMTGFGFRHVPGERWHEPFKPRQSRTHAFRALVSRFVGAASMIVLDGTGMRPGEYVMLRSGRGRRLQIETTRAADRRLLDSFQGGTTDVARSVRRPATLPACVTEALGVSGLSIMLHVHGRVFKGLKHPRKAHWLLGTRQDDGPDPIAMRAIDFMERLSQILRPFAPEDCHDRLCLQIDSSSDETFRCAGMAVGRLDAAITRAIGSSVDLSGIPDWEGIYDLRRYRDSNGRCVSLYQARRTYVQLAYRTEPRLLVALARQLQHRDTVVTNRAYVTSDPILQRELEAQRSRETVAMYREAVEGKVKLGGSMGERIEAFAESIRERILALPARERDGAVAREFRVADYRVHFFEDATCFIGLRPRAALCNRQSGRADWKVVEPDLAVRNAAMCSRCANGCFDRQRHGPAILRRYVLNRLGYLRQRRSGRGQLFMAWHLNAERDRAMLDDLGVPYPTDEELSRGI